MPSIWRWQHSLEKAKEFGVVPSAISLSLSDVPLLGQYVDGMDPAWLQTILSPAFHRLPEDLKLAALMMSSTGAVYTQVGDMVGGTYQAQVMDAFEGIQTNVERHYADIQKTIGTGQVIKAGDLRLKTVARQAGVVAMQEYLGTQLPQAALSQIGIEWVIQAFLPFPLDPTMRGFLRLPMLDRDGGAVARHR